MPEVQRGMIHPQSESMRPSAPYVGLRPYEREERDIFIGRNLDAQYLTDKIFSAKLTLLYSKSGLGKSSILRALVIPALEDEQARVVYFDAWSGEDPIPALKSVLTRLATDLGIPDAGAGSPSLAELVLLISSFDHRTLILILDQFEEFLVHQQGIDQLRAELAELVRAEKLDVRLLISLRQEFLAAMEPFRQNILNLFQSTYLLEPLDEKAVRKAIEEPAQQFGKNYGPGLLNRLLEDLKQTSSRQAHLPSTNSGARIELPMLQLVCDEIWKAVRKQNGSTITSALYRQLGGVGKILKSYIHRVMPRGLRAGYFTARLLVPLAPPSGLKISYSADDLASITGLDEARIRRELKRLARMRILRTRKFQQSERFELYHDSFIKIMAPWRDRILARVRWLRRGGWGLAVFCAVVLVCLGWFQVQGKKQIELYTNTKGAFEKLRSLPAGQRRKTVVNSCFDNAVSYLLWRQEGPGRLIDLKRLLEKYNDLQPPLYGIDDTGMGSIEYPTGDWPVSLHYSFQRDLKWDSFCAAWKEMARFFAEQWNIPVPKRLRLIEENIFPKRLVKFKGPAATKVYLDIETHEADAIINTEGLMPAAREFFDQFKTDWKPIKDVEKGGPYYIVPRWSLAVWRASGIDATDGSGLPAFLLALKLLNQPENLLTSQAVGLLLERVGRVYPRTVSEARAARGPRLRQDLIEWVKLGRGLAHLPVLLDALARYPDAPSADTVAAVGRDLAQTRSASLPRCFTGPWPRPEAAAGSAEPNTAEALPDDRQTIQEKQGDKIHTAYREVEPWLPLVEHSIRVFVGKNLERIWFPTGELSAGLQERIETLRDDFFRQFGYNLPDVGFKESGWDPDFDPDAFRIELLNETAADTQSITTDLPSQSGLDRLIQALRARTRDSRVYLLTPERVEELLDSLEPALRDWLYQRYSLTDLKLLTRAVIDPGLLESSLAQTGAHDIAAPAKEGSLRHFGWLMGSLVFWNQVNDSQNVQASAEALRSTQRARFQPPSVPAGSGPLAAAIADGIRKLADQRLKQAQNAFKRALAIDSESVVNSFLAAYRAHLAFQINAQIERQCKNPTSTCLTRQERLNIEEQLAGTDPAGAPKIHRRDTLCLCSGYPSHFIQRRRELALSLLTQYGSPDQWPATESSWLAIQVLQDFDPVRHDPALLQSASAFFKSAIPRVKPRQSDKAFADLSLVCQKNSARNWCRDLMIETAEKYPVGNIPLMLAYQLSLREHARDLHQALRMLTLARINLDKPGHAEKDRKSDLDFIKLTRAQTLKRLGESGRKSHLSEAEQLFTELLSAPEVSLSAHLDLIDLLLAQERYPEADKHIQGALKAWPYEVMFHQEKFWSELLQGDIDAAAATAREAADRASNKEERLFLAALGQILTGRGQWELAGREFMATNHPYVGYLTMMLYARLAGAEKEEARQLLEQRWAGIESNTWSKRCRGGDANVWQEMLIGYYMGLVSSEAIFGVLEDGTRYQRSELRYLPLCRKSMLCEAYFYDAMLARARGDMAEMRKQLEHVLDTGKSNYLEFKMAKYLLKMDTG